MWIIVGSVFLVASIFFGIGAGFEIAKGKAPIGVIFASICFGIISSGSFLMSGVEVGTSKAGHIDDLRVGQEYSVRGCANMTSTASSVAIVRPIQRATLLAIELDPNFGCDRLGVRFRIEKANGFRRVVRVL